MYINTEEELGLNVVLINLGVVTRKGSYYYVGIKLLLGGYRILILV